MTSLQNNMTSIFCGNLEVIAVEITDINEISTSFMCLINCRMLVDYHFQSNLKVIAECFGHEKNFARRDLKVFLIWMSFK